jgi:hypothetical protein
MAFLACGEALIEVIASNRIPQAGFFSRTVGSASPTTWLPFPEILIPRLQYF